MQNRRLVAIVVAGIAAAAGGGMWVLRTGERAPSSEPPAVASESAPTPEVRPERPVRREPPPIQPRAEAAPAPTPAAPEAVEADSGGREGAQREEWARMRSDAIGRFDRDGDGELNEDERAAARAEWESRAQETRRLMMRRYDLDGDGELNEAERDAARQEVRELRQDIRDRIVPQYDLDGDGELSPAEREAAGPAFRAEFERIRALAELDRDGSRTVDAVELAEAIIGISDGDPRFDLNRDGVTDYRDAVYATEIAQGN